MILIATVSKVLSKVFVERIRGAYELALLPSQYGFRSNRSTVDAIFILRKILEKEKTPLYLGFIDLRAAYDHIPRPALFRCLEVRLGCKKLVAILYTLYKGTRFCVKGSARLLDTLVGCRQGALESPPIFNIYMDTVVRCARKEVLESFPECGARI